MTKPDHGNLTPRLLMWIKFTKARNDASQSLRWTGSVAVDTEMSGKKILIAFERSLLFHLSMRMCRFRSTATHPAPLNCRSICATE
jgi:hypothetical protein